MSDNPKLFDPAVDDLRWHNFSEWTLRDLYIGLMAHAVTLKGAVGPRGHEDIIATEAVALADALLAERAKGKP